MKDKIILVHKGALGDFLQTWPSILSIRKHFPDKNIFWAGREEYYLFLEPLKIIKLDPKLVLDIDKIYTTSTLPESLNEFEIIWFGLIEPPTYERFENLYFVKGIENNNYTPPYKLYLKGIESIGIPPYKRWHKVWQRLFKSRYHKGPKEFDVLIFPGSGHPKKCWDLKNFIEIANRVSDQNLKVAFVMGPAEIERNLKVKNFEQIHTNTLKDLVKTLLKARVVVGNDSGPMHLSGLMDIPTVVIFGPSSPKQWRPYKSIVVYKKIKCSPCTQLGKISCINPLCLKRIRPEDVLKKIEMVLTTRQVL